MPDGDDVVMKGGDDEVRGEQSFNAFPHVRAGLSRASRGAPVSPPPCRNWRCCPCVSDKSVDKAIHVKIADITDGHSISRLPLDCLTGRRRASCAPKVCFSRNLHHYGAFR